MIKQKIINFLCKQLLQIAYKAFIFAAWLDVERSLNSLDKLHDKTWGIEPVQGERASD